jgi:hypothetical protein
MLSIIIPWVRKEKKEACIKAIKAHATSNIIYEIIEEEDTERIGCPKMLAKLVEKAEHEYIMFLGEDTIPQAGFMQAAFEAMRKIPGGKGVVGLNTQHLGTHGNYKAHFMAHKEFRNNIPGGDFFNTGYIHCYGDDELYDIATYFDQWQPCHQPQLLHDHPINKRNLKVEVDKKKYIDPDEDEHYKRIYSNNNLDHDRNLYFKRKYEFTKLHLNFKLAICIPLTWPYVRKEFFLSMIRNDFPSNSVMTLPTHPNNLGDIRNDLVYDSLRKGCTHSLFIDSDQIFHTENFPVKMLETMIKNDYKVLSAPVHRRYPGFDPLLLKGVPPSKLDFISDEDAYSGKIIEISATGCGCLMIDNSVFIEHVEHPWFKHDKDEEGSVIGEDIYFFGKLYKTGIKAYTDTSIEITHMTSMGVDKNSYFLYKQQQSIQKRIKEKKDG